MILSRNASRSIQLSPGLLSFDWLRKKERPDPNPGDSSIHRGLVDSRGYALTDMLPEHFRGRISLDGVEYPACCDIRQRSVICASSPIIVTGIKMGRLTVTTV